MFSLIIQKLLHKKWMVICLLIGYILLISVAICHPMYRTSSFQRMLTDEFKAYEEKYSKWPTVFSVNYRKAGKNTGLSVSTLENFIAEANEVFDVELKEKALYYTMNEIKVEPLVMRDENVGRAIKISTMTNLEDHIIMVSGRMPQEGIVDDGFIEVIVSTTAEQVQDLMLDEEYTSTTYSDINGDKFKIRVVGIFKKADTTDPYWSDSSLTLNKDGFVSEQTFRDLFMDGEDKQKYYSFNLNWYNIWDYSSIKPQDVKHLIAATASVKETQTLGKLVQANNYEKLLGNYSNKAKKVEATLLILQVPALLLLCAFLYMISGQMLSMEQNEISLMKSRGAKRGQIIGLYFMQSLLLGIVSLVAALPLGRMMCSILGSASDFLEFSSTRELEVTYSKDIIVYAAGALLAGVLMTVIPVISYSKVGIVNLKQGKHKRKRSLWKVMCLDIMCLAVSMYGFYNFNHNSASVSAAVLTGDSLDPLIYFSSSLFILGAGLLLLRIQPWLVKLIYMLTKRSMRPAPYASFLETIRSGGKQEFIMIFMIMTVALGIFNASVARTIVSNAENNTEYIYGADIVLKESWADNGTLVQMDPEIEFKYYEPDYNKYSTIDGVEATAKVLRNQNTSFGGVKNASGVLMGVNPADFAKVTDLDDSLNMFDFYDYLNVLAAVDNGALASMNMMTKLGLKIGDTISFSESHYGRTTVKIMGFFDYWPSYEPETYLLNRDGSLGKLDQYMVVTNLSYLQNEWDVTPYEVWVKTSDTTPFYEFIDSRNNLKFSKFKDLGLIKEDIRTDTLFQGTNGILTMSFIIVLLLCAVGYLIYWIMSIRSRELLFGVLRAMGMRKGEITGMLVIEQIFCGLYSIVAGAFVGILSAKLFVPLVQGAYAADNQVLPLAITTSTNDLLRLFAVILGVMILCLAVIGRIVSHMNISDALKLGED